MESFADYGAFDWVVFGCACVMGIGVLAGVVLAVKTRDELSRAVLSDLVFYGMLCMYLAWSVTHHNSIAFDIALLASLVCGIVPTLSLSRIISKGRR